LFRQLKDQGRLACVLRAGPAPKAMLYRRSGEEVGGRPIFDAGAPVLPGYERPPAFAF
jgi:protein-L-isoaspartate(D-aspartate) O-methyltransferase